MFEQLTQYLDILKPGNYGTFVEPTQGDDGKLIIHGYEYSKDVLSFEEDIYRFAEHNPQFEHNRYLEIIKENNIDLNEHSLYTKKLKHFETSLVFIILFSIIRSEHLCEGAIMDGLEKGNIQCCLKELKSRDCLYSPSNVKEISIVSNFVFMIFNDYWYKDLLRISRNWVSYRRNNFSSGEVVSEWSYKTLKPNSNWDYLVEEIIKVFQREEPRTFKTDSGYFNLRVTFKNGEHWDLKLSSNFAANDLKDLAFMIKRMIPFEETEYPDVLNVISLFLYDYSLTRNNLKDIKKEDICALMYAEGGAMGSPGEVCIIDINGRKFFTRGIYSEDDCDISQIEVIDTYFGGLVHIDGFRAPDYANCVINDKPWKYINLGFGNHLYVRNDFWGEHGNRIADVEEVQRYTNWKRLIKD